MTVRSCSIESRSRKCSRRSPALTPVLEREMNVVLLSCNPLNSKRRVLLRDNTWRHTGHSVDIPGRRSEPTVPWVRTRRRVAPQTGLEPAPLWLTATGLLVNRHVVQSSNLSFGERCPRGDGERSRPIAYKQKARRGRRRRKTGMIRVVVDFCWPISSATCVRCPPSAA